MKEAGTTHLLATIGSGTQRGGRVDRATLGRRIKGFRIALVGDVVAYADGSEAVIANGVGYGLTDHLTPYVLVGSRLSNGHCITRSLPGESFYVGSQLDNGDVITDSPEREGVTCSDMFTILRGGSLIEQEGIIRC
ncbi:hypothetical protein [Caballeronia concitans]|uniref:PAAR repeat-containing protein n=1 Tax=Caballeronia concitans TaxID=1777133 RepID=A0A658QUM3_9BURK|nr:hypothetical protein [Caballeronia concitans]KIG09427.1 hypothetical protein BurMR1_3103 [Burkholderia sp. MR1]SAL22785.1 hypothetical protein AWB72_01625 [Caballeronia concitans]